MTTTILLWIAGTVLVLVGFAGVVLPALPGPAFVYLGIVLIAWAHAFERIGVLTLIVLGVLAAGVLLVDYVAASVGTKRYGGGRWGVGGAIVGAVVGVFFPPLGLVLGPLAGAILGELVAGRTANDAARAGWGAFLGFLGGTVVKYLLCGAMVLAAAVDHVF